MPTSRKNEDVSSEKYIKISLLGTRLTSKNIKQKKMYRTKSNNQRK